MIDDHIRCFLDGRKALEVSDGTFKDAGMIGLWTKADASSSFDDLRACEVERRRQKHRDSDHDDDEEDDDDAR